MEGLKTQEGNKFNNFFIKVQKEAKDKNCVFFLDAGDGREFETETIEGEDLMGWLIPYEQVSEFKELWLKNKITDKWSTFYCWAIWENIDDVKIKFEFNS